MHGATAWNAQHLGPPQRLRAGRRRRPRRTRSGCSRTRSNRQLYINGLPAADFGNAAYRAWWIAAGHGAGRRPARALRRRRFMERRTYRSNGASSTARDPRTSVNITEANWQRYMADFMVELRAALPAAEIVHDVIWYKGDTRADIVRELAAADARRDREGLQRPDHLRRLGHLRVADAGGLRRAPPGLRPGRDPRRPRRRRRPAHLRHRRRCCCSTPARLALGNDLWTAPGPLLDRLRRRPRRSRPARATAWSGLWRRDFADGIVLVNETGGVAARRRAFGTGFTDLAGVALKDGDDGARAAAILRKVPRPDPDADADADPDAGEPTPAATPTPSPSSHVATATPRPRRRAARAGARATRRRASPAPPSPAAPRSASPSPA